MEDNNKYYRVGKIINTHGIKGEVKVQAITDRPQKRFEKDNKLFISKNGEFIPVTVVQSRPQKQFWLIKFAEINDIDAAKNFQKSELFIAESDLQDPGNNRYYYKDIIGIEVDDQKRGKLGKVTDIMNLPHNDVWTIKMANGKEILIPIMKDVLLSVDLDKNIAMIDLPEGLINEN